MSIYKIKVRCIECKHLWTEDAEVDVDTLKCPLCNKVGGLKLAIFNDSIANIDDERSDRYDGA